jgi:DNA-binding transcriptional regulator YbjK
MARMTADYVQRPLLNRRDFLMAEQAFRQEALLCPRLAELVRAHEQILLHGARQMLQVVGSRQPAGCQMLTAIIEQMEYQGLLKDANAQADGQMLAILTDTCSWCWPRPERDEFPGEPDESLACGVVDVVIPAAGRLSGDLP